MNSALLGREALWRSAGRIACGPPSHAQALRAGKSAPSRLFHSANHGLQTGQQEISIWSHQSTLARQLISRSSGRHHASNNIPFSRTFTKKSNATLTHNNNPYSKTSTIISNRLRPLEHPIRAWQGHVTFRQRYSYSDDTKNKNHVESSAKETRVASKETNNSSSSEPITPPDQKQSTHHDFRDYLPGIPNLHRPSREELLAAASGFFSRLKVRFKWASIRSMRPFNNDEIGAFISIVAFGHVVWLFIGTTTFISLAIWAINSIFAQETLAKWVGNYLTQASGLQVVFESAVVPKWGDGVISFRNVFVSRRPGLGQGQVSKGSPETVAAVRAAAEEADGHASSHDTPDEDQNYTQFDVTIDTVNVTLSFTKWWNSKGLLKDVEVKGVRGVVDRTHVHTEEGVDPRSYKHEHVAGDFEIENFKLEDLLVTLHQPEAFRPFSVSIYTCELPRLRKQWLFYDFLSASHCSGAYDDSQFNIHPRQMHGHVGLFVDNGVEEESGENPWRQHNRLRIDGLSIDHLNTGVEGPFGWINRGNVDIVADVMFPADPDESISRVVSEMYGKLEETVSSRLHLRVGEEANGITNEGAEIVHMDKPKRTKRKSATADATNIGLVSQDEEHGDRRCIVMDLRVRINDIRATPPAFPKDISYIDNALIRPIVGFLNSRPNWVPINGRLVKRVGDFDGSWTLFDSGLMDEVSEEVGLTHQTAF